MRGILLGLMLAVPCWVIIVILVKWILHWAGGVC